MAMEEEEKRKTMTSEGGNYNSRSGDGRLFPPPELPHDWVAAEILTRLPAKSLMRFKCVPKLWLSTILDPGFCEAHRARAGPHCLYKYYIGFDYLIRRFKVLRVCSIQGALFCISQCDILTLGGEAESWRRLHAAPPIHIIGGGGGGAEGKENSVYIDGERHWWHSSGCFLVSFCFTDEEFQLIDLPPGLPELGGSLHEFRGRLALVTGVKNRKLRMWLLGWSDDDEGGGEYEYE